MLAGDYEVQCEFSVNVLAPQTDESRSAWCLQRSPFFLTPAVFQGISAPFRFEHVACLPDWWVQSVMIWRILHSTSKCIPANFFWDTGMRFFTTVPRFLKIPQPVLNNFQKYPRMFWRISKFPRNWFYPMMCCECVGAKHNLVLNAVINNWQTWR